MTMVEQQHANLPSEHTRKQLSDARNELDVLCDHKLKGIIVRSKARCSEEGEKNTNIFLT